MKIGLLGCVHGSVPAARKALSKFKRASVDAVVVHGDLGDTFKEIQGIVRTLSRSDVPCIVMPGSHEPARAYKKAIAHAKVNDGLRQTQWLVKDGLVQLIPGSDSISKSGEFMLAWNKKEVKRRTQYLNQFWKGKRYHPIFARLRMHHPKQTLVIGHVPPRFTQPHAIDVAHFGRATKDFTLRNAGTLGAKHVAGSIYVLKNARKLVKRGAPVRILKKNVGNPHLATLFRARKVRFFACAHIHEAGHRGVTRNGRTVKPGRWTPELFYNSGCARDGSVGIIELSHGKARYRNVKL
ncbi:MAG TPA: metallophosphoesterase [Candidatus Binatia bacterium]|nr:metallophosphoesterase [Candidatus Binatia bacterium]